MPVGDWLRGRTRALLLCFGAALCCLALRGQALAPASTARALTVERIYSAPSLSGRILRDTSWSPDGKLLTYLDQNGLAGPQLMAVDAATGRRQVLIDAAHLRNILLPPVSRGQQTGLGRLAPKQYLWAPDSQALLFISARELFWYELRTETSRTLFTMPENEAGDGASLYDAKISPDSRWVTFVRNHDLWIVSANGGAARPLTTGGSEAKRNGELDWVYPEELDMQTAYWWSPDSSKVAFLQLDESRVEKYPLVDFLLPEAPITEERYPVAGSPNPVARPGVLSVAGRAAENSAGSEVHWMDTGADPSALLARVAWLADSRRVAIERLNRAQTRLDLLFADAVTGASEIALTEQDKYWINLADDLYFLSDGKRFLWSSERTGFRHLYLYDVSGKQLAQLTHGAWEVDGVNGVDEKSGEVYFTSTEQSPIERQLYRVSLLGGDPVPLTHEHGTHDVDFAPGCGHFLDSYSNANTPPRQDLHNADGSRVATVEENQVPELASYHLRPVEFLTVPTDDGTSLEAELIKPAGFDPSRKYPVLVNVYGGPQIQSVLDEWDGSTFLWNELMSQKGFVIFELDNRGTSGRGHSFEIPIYHQFGKIELQDQLAGVAWLRRQPYVDASRIGIWGWSYGGYMTCMALLRAGDVFKAGFAGAPVTDWRQYDTIYTERYMGTPEDNPQGYANASPVTYAAALQGKLLIAHATGDDNVHFGNTVELAEKFVEAGKYAEYQIYAGRGHGISDATAQIHIFDRVTQFFLENLGK